MASHILIILERDDAYDRMHDAGESTFHPMPWGSVAAVVLASLYITSPRPLPVASLSLTLKHRSNVSSLTAAAGSHHALSLPPAHKRTQPPPPPPPSTCIYLFVIFPNSV